MNSAKYIELFKNGQKEGIRDVTVKRKLQTVRKFLSYLEDAQTDLSNIDRKNVYEFVNSLDYRSQTISGVQFTLRQFFNIMYKQGMASFDGYQLFPMITTDKRDSILSYYSPEEIKILVESIDTAKKCGIRDKCMILIAAECGLRASDIIWLRFDEINWDKKLISKTQHKTGLHVNVPFTEQVQFLLLDYLKNHLLAFSVKIFWSLNAAADWSSANRLNAIIPGITIINGMISFRPAANIIPFCPSARLDAPSVRWIIYWLNPQ